MMMMMENPLLFPRYFISTLYSTGNFYFQTGGSVHGSGRDF